MSEQVTNSKSNREQQLEKSVSTSQENYLHLVNIHLGPNGLDNMLVDTAGDSVITNDGATIIKQSAIDHAVAKVIMHVARHKKSSVSTGPLLHLILTGEMMEQAAEPAQEQIHPTKIALGFQIAASRRKSSA